jgi:hypothetical protein|uniref:Uncharacterized protein n=1 Tax=viral metagenome TaxID=1070528 RepID=A0A6C0J6K7_9ZZZZ
MINTLQKHDYNSNNMESFRLQALHNIIQDIGLNATYELCMSSGNTQILCDLTEVASDMLSKEQLICCYTLIKDKQYYDIKFYTRQNEMLQKNECMYQDYTFR